MKVGKIISPSRRNLISRIVFPRRNIRIQEMSNPELNKKLHGAQEHINELATRYRVGFSFTEVPLYHGCLVTCHKGKKMTSSDYITVHDDDATIANKISAPVYSMVTHE